MKQEDYLLKAFAMNPNSFMQLLQRDYSTQLQEFEELCKSTNTLGEFRASPLIFILANQSKDLLGIATEFMDDDNGEEEKQDE